MMRMFLRLFFITGLSLLILFFSLLKGSMSIPADQLSLLLQLRLPRTLTAFVCGGLLALSGTLMQLLLQNPLADPYTLGTSGAAAFVTLLLMLFGINEYGLIGGAFFGSLLTIALMLALSRKHRFETHALLLTGIALASGFSALISFILFLSPDKSLHSMLFWLTGDLNDAHYPLAGFVILTIGFFICVLLAPGFNILRHGEKEASALGLATKKYRIAIYLLSALFTATAVTLSGCIGFIGLMIPHLSRRLFGHDHRLLLPISLLLGGSLLMLADTFARTLFAPEQLPVGILLALIGVPVFVWLVQK